MFHNYSTTILDLPLEIMVKIVNKLNYTDVQSVRLTCWVFNDAGMYVQKTALHKMKRLADSALDKCYTGFLKITEDNGTGGSITRLVRALKGSASVNYLARITRVADASTYHFVLDGSLPPVPCALLTDLEKALSIATRRNPLVGRDRLKRIFAGFDRYMNSLHSPLKMTSVFRSVMDLFVHLASLCPHKAYSIDHKPYGLRCHIYLNSSTIILSRNDFDLTAPLLIRFLAKLNVKVIDEFISGWEEYQTRMRNLFAEEIQTVDATIDHIELDIHCRPEQSVVVRSLEQLRRLEPTDFEVRLHGVTSVRRPSQRNSSNIRLDPWRRGTPLREGEKLATCTFKTSLPSS